MKNKIVSLLLCLSLICTLCTSSITYAGNLNGINNSNIKKIVNNKDICQVMTEYNGVKYIASLDKNTDQITIKESDTPNLIDKLIFNKKATEKNYLVKVENSDSEKFSATVYDNQTKQKYKIAHSDKVKAQFVVALPIALELAQALIQALIAAAAVIVMGGITYYLAKEVVQRVRDSNNYGYFYAYIDKKAKNVYIGSAIDPNTAYTYVRYGGDIFCRSQTLAKNMAMMVGGLARGPEKHGDEGYYNHYHPKYAYGEVSHCFY